MCLFLIGSPSIPPLGFDKNITMKFKNYCIDNKCQHRTTAPTCPLDFTLPVHFSSSEGFTSKFSDIRPLFNYIKEYDYCFTKTFCTSSNDFSFPKMYLLQY